MNLSSPRNLMKSLLLIAMTFYTSAVFSQVSTTSTASGNWSTGSNWTSGTAPTGSGTVNVNRPLTLDVDLTISGVYTFNANVTDPCTAGSAACHTVTVNNGGAALTIKSGTTVTLGPTTFLNNSIVVIESGATLIIQGDLTNWNNSTDITINGTLQVNGNFYCGNQSNIDGTGTVNTTGAIIPSGGNEGTIFGQVVNCSSGPCSGNICVANTISASPTQLCTSGNVILDGNTLSGYSYKWQTGTTSSGPFTDVTALSVTNEDYSVTSLTTTTWFRRYVVNSGATCQSYSPPVQVTVTPTPSAPAVTSPLTYCQNASAPALTATGSNLKWYTVSSGGTGSSTAPIPSTTTVGTTNFYVSQTVSGCESARSIISVSVIAKPTITSSLPGSVCTGTALNYTITSSNASATFFWDRAAVSGISNAAVSNQTSNPITETLVNTTSGALNVSYVITPVVGSCSGTASTQTIAVNPRPSVNASGTATICSGNSTTLSASGSGGTSPYTYAWSGTGLSANNVSSPLASPTATTTTTYTYTVTATDSKGCLSSNSASVTVTVKPTPTVTAGSNSPICSGGTLNLTATTATGTSFSWTGPSTFTSTSQNPSRTPVVAGTYSVTTALNGCTSTASTVNVVVGTPLSPTAASNSPLCAGSTLNLSIANATGATYSWTGPNGFTSTSGTPSLSNVTSAAAGTYTVTASLNGCTGNASTSVVVNPKPTVTASAAVSPICSGSSTTVSGVGAGGTAPYAYSWSGAPISATNIQSPTVNPTTSTTYSVTATDNKGCTSAIGTVAVNVNPTPSVTSASTGSVCSGTQLSYTITGTGTSYKWSRAAVTNISNSAVSNQFTNPIQETLINTSAAPVNVTYIITPSTASCTGSAFNYVVTVNPTPAINSSLTGTICSGVNQNYTITSNISGSTYSWSRNAVTGISNVATSLQTVNPITEALVNTTASNVNVTYNITPTSSAGCVGASSNYVVTVKPAPVATITPGAVTICTGCSTTLTASTGTSYAWSPGGQTTQSITVNTAGTYTVTVSGSNGCSATSAATTVTVNSNCAYTWTGASDNSWSNVANWSQCSLPTVNNDVTIPAGATRMPVISGTASCKNLTLQSGTTLTNNAAGVLTLAGDFVATGAAFTDNGSVILNGSTSQTLTDAGTFNKLTLNNAAGAVLGTNTTVKGILTLTSGALTSNGKLTLNLNTGAISGTGTGSIAGNITVLKDVTTYGEYHMLGNPLTGSNITFSQLSDDATIRKGLLFSYNETVVSSNYMDGWDYAYATSPMTGLRGYALYFMNSAILDITGSYNHNMGTQSISVSNSPSSDINADGWNLISNPYPSPINWSPTGLTRVNVDNAVYTWNAETSSYTSYVNGVGTNGGTNIIPSMQAFWVHCNNPGGTGSVSMTNSIRTTAQNPALWKAQSEENILKIKTSSGKYKDETVILVSEEASMDFDSQLDAYKLENDGNPNIYTKYNNIPYSINNLPVSEELVLPVILDAGFDGNYALNAEGVESFGTDYSIYLIDTLLHIEQDLRNNPEYNASLVANDTTARFFIKFKKAEDAVVSGVSGGSSDANSVSIGSNGTRLFVKAGTLNGTATITLENLIGNTVSVIENAILSEGIFSSDINVAVGGIYLVKVKIGDRIYNGKVYLK